MTRPGNAGVRLIGDPIDDEDEERPSVSLAATGSTAPGASNTRSAAGPASDARSYRVESGDSWIGIARDHGVSYSQLLEANPEADPERIRIGQVLRIPAAGSDAAPRSHRVVTGDTLSEIAARYDISVGSLREANDLTSDAIRVGQVLVLPAD